MLSKFSRRLFITQILIMFAACEGEKKSTHNLELVIGLISYGEEIKALERFRRFREYLGDKIPAMIQIEPTFNENKALDRIKHRAWSLVFAPPGLVALAKDKYQYVPIFPLAIGGNLRSIFVVRQDSPVKKSPDLQLKTVVLGLPGDAAGYYFPLYNLYGLTLGEILFAPTPKAALEWVAQGKAMAGAMSLDEFNLYKNKIAGVDFRILFTDAHTVPPGAVLISSEIDRNRQELIRKYMQQAPPTIIQEVGYVANGEVPDYQYMISVVNRVTSIATNLNSKPVRLF